MYWDTPICKSVNYASADQFKNLKAMQPNEEGWNCDKLQPSKAIFLGHCDIQSPVKDQNQTWSKMLHNHLYSNEPYIAMGLMGSGTFAQIRHLYAYCEAYGAPEHLYLVMGRPFTFDIPTEDGRLIAVNEVQSRTNFLIENNLITQLDFERTSRYTKCITELQTDTNYVIYQFEQVFVFWKLLCERYNIKMHWTLNPEYQMADHCYRGLPSVLNSMPWALKTCVGIARCNIYGPADILNLEKHITLFELFKNNKSVTVDDCLKQLSLNLFHTKRTIPKTK